MTFWDLQFFYFGHLIIYSFDIVVVTLFTNVKYPSYCLWNYKRDVNFMNNVTTTLSDEEITKIKVVDLDKFYNFYVHDFSAEII